METFDSIGDDLSVERLVTAISGLMPEAKVALIRMVGTIEDRGDVMSVLLLSDQLTNAIRSCQTKPKVTEGDHGQ